MTRYRLTTFEKVTKVVLFSALLAMLLLISSTLGGCATTDQERSDNLKRWKECQLRVDNFETDGSMDPRSVKRELFDNRCNIK